MATVAPSSDQAADLLQKLSLESQAKTTEAPEASKKSSTFNRGSGDAKESNGTIQPSERSTTPLIPEFTDPTMCYLPNGYASAYYYGGYEGSMNEWDDYARYGNPDAHGAYGDNGSLMYHGYGYTPYGSYSAAGSPVPTIGQDGQLYGQQYQYPAYYQSPTSSNEVYNSKPAPAAQGDLSATVAADKPVLSVEVPNGNAKGSLNGNSSGPMPLRPSQLNSSLNGRASVIPGSVAASAYQDARYKFDGKKSPVSWLDAPAYSDTKHRPASNSTLFTSASHTNNIQAGRNQNLHPMHNMMGLQSSRPTSGIGSTPGYVNRMYPNSRMYAQYGNNFRTGNFYGSNGYDSRAHGHGWLAVDNKYKPKGRGNGFFAYGNENMDGLNELNRGPRARGFKNQKGASSITLAVKGQDIPLNVHTDNKDNSSANPDREQYNRENFPINYTDAKFFVIKSYSEDDVHKSIKYNVWASTPNGNKKLDAGYKEAQEKSGDCPVFLLFSVNTSGQFVGLAEMVGPVDFNKSVEYWQQDKWNGCFQVKWHIVKDIPNNLLKHITLENNDNKPVTNSRDTQEVKLEQGLQILKIFKDHSSKTCILDDFEFYEGRQKTVQEKKAKQQQLQKQVWEGKPIDVTTSEGTEKEGTNGKPGLQNSLDVPPTLPNCVVEAHTNMECNQSEKNQVIAAEDASKSVTQGVTDKKSLANGISNGC